MSSSFASGVGAPEGSEPPTELRLVFRVHSYEVDPDYWLTPRALGNYLQEAAGKHARLLGVSMERLAEERRAWVLRRLRIAWQRQARMDARLEVHTWPESFARGPLAHRHFVVRDEAGEVARAISQWVLVDLDRRRASRFPEWMQSIPVGDHGMALGLDKASLPSVDELDAASEASWQVEVGQAAIDVVGHVTNTQYLEWLLESVPADWQREHRLAELEVEFVRESSRGDRLLARSRAGVDGEWRHRIEDDIGELRVRARSRWRAPAPPE